MFGHNSSPNAPWATIQVFIPMFSMSGNVLAESTFTNCMIEQRNKTYRKVSRPTQHKKSVTTIRASRLASLNSSMLAVDADAMARICDLTDTKIATYLQRVLVKTYMSRKEGRKEGSIYLAKYIYI